jgi:uncharacterized membrane protein
VQKRDLAVSNSKLDANSEPANRVPVPVGDQVRLTRTFVTTAATIGVVAAGVALLEVALIPGMVIGAAAVLAPNFLPKRRRRLPSRTQFRRRIEPALSNPAQADVNTPAAAPVRFAFKQAIAKTVTYRIIVTTLDFTVNYVVIGELATAAGLSAFALTVGPLFYLAHEAAWNYLAVSDKRIELGALLPFRPEARQPEAGWRGVSISRALAKTITFRSIATTMDFTTNFVVVGDLATAAVLSASGFILGPFVYLGHEMVWDHYGSPAKRTLELPAPTNLTLAPG